MAVSAFFPLLRADGAVRLGGLGLGAILTLAVAEVAGPVLLGLAVTHLAAPSLPGSAMPGSAMLGAGAGALLLAGGFVVCRLLSGGLGGIRDDSLYRLGRRLTEAATLRAVDPLVRQGQARQTGRVAEPLSRGVEAVYGVTEALVFGVLPVLVQTVGVTVALLMVAGPLYALLGLSGAAAYTAVVTWGLVRQAPGIARLNVHYAGIQDAMWVVFRAAEAERGAGPGADNAAFQARNRLVEGFAGVRGADLAVAGLHLRFSLLGAVVPVVTLAAVIGLSAQAVLSGAAPVGLLVMVVGLTQLLFSPLHGLAQQIMVAGRQVAALMPLIDLLDPPAAR